MQLFHAHCISINERDAISEFTIGCSTVKCKVPFFGKL